MRLHRAMIIARREWRDAVANRAMLISLAVLPTIMVLGPLPMLWSNASPDPDAVTTASAVIGTTGYVHPSVVAKLLRVWSGLFLMLPVIVPLAIGAQSIVGEREKRTIEPLLATPIEPSEILVGKMLAALVPGLFITWGAYAAFCGLVDWAGYPMFHRLIAPDEDGLLSMLLLSPTIAVLGNGLVVAVSARVSDTRLASQISGLLVLPLLGFVTGPTLLGQLFGPSFYFVAGALLVVADLVVYKIAVMLFDRERLISTVR
jgi:ABC-type Na+ efflux pump permease subunit